MVPRWNMRPDPISSGLAARLGQLQRELIGLDGLPLASRVAPATIPASTPVKAPVNAPARQDSNALPGEECETEWGTHWVVRQRLEQVWPASVRYLNEAGEPRSDGGWGEVPLSARAELSAAWLRQRFPHGTLFLDLETCGLAGSCIFLAGLIHWHEGRLTLTQLWARHYGEEKPLLQSLLHQLAGQAVVVTYNGRSFDWPQVQDRCILHRLEPPGDDGLLRWRQARARERRGGGRRGASRKGAFRQGPAGTAPFAASPAPQSPRPVWTPEPDDWLHLDLLHVARRWWRGQVPNFRLQTLERLVCGRRRVDDVAGAEIPRAYHDYVRNGTLEPVRAILHHNALDLVTCLQLLLVLFKPREQARAS